MKEVNQAELSRIIGLTTRQVHNLEAHGIPHRADGRHKLYPIPDAVQWYVRWKQDEARAEVAVTDYGEARARRELARARLAELEVAKSEREVLPIEVVEEVYGDRLLDVLRSAILNTPGRWGAQIVGLDSPREGEAALTSIAHELLEHLSGEAADDLGMGEAIPLPDDVPARAVLVAAGVETLADLLALDDLTEVPGVGPARAAKIQEWIEVADYAA